VGKKEKRQDQTEGLHRYFVNIGRIDGVTPGDLIHFLSDVSNVERQHFSQVTLQKNYAFFYLDKNQDKGFANHFKGLEIEGHVIRVNRDDTGNKPDKIGNKKKKGRGDSRKSSGRRRHR
jgi:ATP-dependent RNA helicase DeaD